MPESRCPHCGKSSELLLADRWARLLGPDQLSLAESGAEVACPACGHRPRAETHALGLPNGARFRVIAFAFLIAILAAGVYACLLAGAR
jgi:DNA-directed RNA polymerase subunit RPC12/RpoP